MSTRSISIGIVTSGWALVIATASVLGQWTQGSSSMEQTPVAARNAGSDQWTPHFTTPGAPPAPLATRVAARDEPRAGASPFFSRSNVRGRAVQASYQATSQSQADAVFADGDNPADLGQLEPVPAGEPIPPGELLPSNGKPGCKNCGTPDVLEQYGDPSDESYGCESCQDPCSVCGGPHGGCDCEEDCFLILKALARRDLVIFAGTHGFKGPADLGQNGNFGFQEGLNFGAPLGDPWGLGYQVGFNAVQSDFAGYRSDVTSINDPARRGSRNQIFVTAGIFKRATAGPQWGVVFDFQRDQYYGWTDLKQVRSESGWVFASGTEIGYFGAYRAGGDQVRTNWFLQPTDMFAGFIRRYFQTGAEGRIWGGATGNGDGLIGADFRVPLGGSIALENRFNYLLPKQGNAIGGQGRESWGLVMQITWYPGKKATCMNQREFLPLINVADNATFMQQLQMR